jgi:hypothetical protein
LKLNGNIYQRPLERLLRLLPEYKRLVLGGLSGDKATVAAVEAQAAEIDRAVIALGEADQAVGKELQFTEGGLRKRRRESLLMPKVRSRWVALKNISAGRDPEACRSAHDALRSDVPNCIAHVGDTSNLIRDPELATYYLVDVTLGVLPGNQERLAHSIECGCQAGATDAPSEANAPFSPPSFESQKLIARRTGCKPASTKQWHCGAIATLSTPPSAARFEPIEPPRTNCWRC